MNNESMCVSCKHLHVIEYFIPIQLDGEKEEKRCIYRKGIYIDDVKNCNKWKEKDDEV